MASDTSFTTTGHAWVARPGGTQQCSQCGGTTLTTWAEPCPALVRGDGIEPPTRAV